MHKLRKYVSKLSTPILIDLAHKAAPDVSAEGWVVGRTIQQELYRRLPEGEYDRLYDDLLGSNRHRVSD